MTIIDWQQIETVLLDMDGTLLDLNFDNHFWLEYVPIRYAELNKLTIEQANYQLIPQFKEMEGKLEWYCLDYWSEVLELDMIGLKTEIAGLITVLPHVMEFLEAVRKSSRKIMLVTNAHRAGLDIKMRQTCIQPFFDQIISSHDFGCPKESQTFWKRLYEQQFFNRKKTLLVDDSLAVLKSARLYGIEHLISVSKPDSQQPERSIIDFPAIEDFRMLMAGL